MPKNLFSTIKSLLKETIKSAKADNIALHGAAIAFYTIFSTAPLIVIILAITSFFVGDAKTAEVFTNYLTQLTNADIAHSLVDFADFSRKHASNIIASVIALGILFFGATTVITQLKNSLNTLWGITKPKISSVSQYFFNRLLALIIIFVLTGLFLTSLLLEGGMSFFSGLFLPYLPDIFTPVLQLASSLISILITIIFFTLIFKILPDVHARWKDIFVGACVTTILFLIGKYLVGFYLASSSLEAAYKTSGAFIIFLIWIYYNVQIVLIGAEFTQVYTKRLGKNLRASWNAELINFE